MLPSLGLAQAVSGTLPEDYLPGLRPILDAALRQSPAVLAQQVSILQAEAAVDSSRAGMLPSLGLSGSYGWNKSEFASRNNNVAAAGSGSTSSGLYYSAALAQPIWQWGALKNALDVSKLGREIAQKQYAEAYRTLAANLRAQYLGLIYRKASLAHLRVQAGFAKRQIPQAQARVAAGEGAAVLVDAELADAEADFAMQRAEADFNSARNALVRLAGLDSLADSAIPDAIPMPDVERTLGAMTPGFPGAGPAGSLRAQIYSLYLEQARKRYDIEKTGLLPKVSLSSGFGLNNTVNASTGSVSQSAVETYSYGLAVSWPIFDGFRTRAAKASARAAIRRSEMDLKAVIEDQGDQAVAARRQVELSGQALRLAERRLALEAAALRVMEADFNNTTTTRTVSEANLEQRRFILQRAQITAFSARAEFLSRWVEYLSVLGVDPAVTAAAR